MGGGGGSGITWKNLERDARVIIWGLEFGHRLFFVGGGSLKIYVSLFWREGGFQNTILLC